jgi:hypothetical protein
MLEPTRFLAPLSARQRTQPATLLRRLLDTDA